MKNIDDLQEYIVDVLNTKMLLPFTKDLLSKYDDSICKYNEEKGDFDSELTLMRAIMYELRNVLQVFDRRFSDYEILEQFYAKANNVYQFYEQGHWIITDDVIPVYDGKKETLLLRLSDGQMIMIRLFDRDKCSLRITHFMRVPIIKMPGNEKEVQD